MAALHHRIAGAVRMLSTIIGQSGRRYAPEKVLQRHPKDAALDITFASGEGRPYVIKPVSQSIFDFLQEFKAEFGENPRLRHHVDENKQEGILVYEYVKSDLLALVQNWPLLPLQARKAILREVGLALCDMHEKNWMYLDVKPNNVFLNWRVDYEDRFHLQTVVLGDQDCALKLQGDKLLNHRIGNMLWRSPEGQLGKGIGKPSEVFSYALLCLYVITGAQCFQPDFEKLETEPEPVVLYKLLCVFGPLPDALVKHVNDGEAGELLRALQQGIADQELSDPFEQWSEEVFPNLDCQAKKMILRMTNLDPANRASMRDIMQDPYWQDVQGPGHIFEATSKTNQR